MKKNNRWSNSELLPLQQFRNELNEVFENFFEDKSLSSKGDLFSQSESLVPAMNIEEKDNSYLFEVEVPGVDPKDVDIELNGNVMTIKGEKTQHDEKKGKGDKMRIVEHSYGSFYRSFTLPANINSKNITAENKNGMLYITVPKAEVSDTHHIEIKGVEK